MRVNNKTKKTHNRPRANQYAAGRKKSLNPLSMLFSGLTRVTKITLTAAFTLLVVGGFSFILVFGYNELLHSKYFEVKKVVLKGLNRLSQQEALVLTGLNDQQANILGVRLKDMARRLQGHPWVDEVHITREMPDTIVIVVTERKAEALLDIGRLYFLDGKGKPFKKAGSEDKKYLPVITGITKNDYLKQPEIINSALLDIFTLLHVLEQRNDQLRLGNIARVQFDQVRGLTVTTRDDLEVKVGFGHYETKFHRLGRVLVHLKLNGLYQEPAYINLECGPRVVIRPAVKENETPTGSRENA